MTFRKALVAIPAGAMLAAAAIAPVATSAHSVSKHAKHHAQHHAKKNHGRVRRADTTSYVTTTCNGIARSTPGNLVVPDGKTCTIPPGTTIGHDVTVGTGSTLIDKGGSIGHNISAIESPKAIGIDGTGGTMGYVGNDINVGDYGDGAFFGAGTGVTGSGPSTIKNGENYICNTQVVHDINVWYSSGKAARWIIGDYDEGCTNGGNYVGHDLYAEYNNNRVDVSDNRPPPISGGMGGIKYDLNVLHNLLTATSPVVESNTIGHNAYCQSGTKKDGDGSSNLVLGMNSGCP